MKFILVRKQVIKSNWSNCRGVEEPHSAPAGLLTPALTIAPLTSARPTQAQNKYMTHTHRKSKRDRLNVVNNAVCLFNRVSSGYQCPW